MNHHKLFKSTILVLTCILAQIGNAQLDTAKSKFEIEEIGTNLYLAVQQTNIANPSTVFFCTPKVTVVIDPGFKQMQKKLLDSIRARGGADIAYVMVTHFHTDHAQSIPQFYNKTPLILSSSQYIDARSMDIKHVLSAPDTLNLKLGEEELQVISLANQEGHTGEDAVFFFRKANVLVVGDYLFQNMYPIIDTKGGGSINGYLENIEALIQLANTKTKIVPGHTSFKAVNQRYLDRLEYQNYLDLLKESIVIIQNMKASRLSLEEAISQGLPEKFAPFNEGMKYVSEKKWITSIYENF